MRRIFAVLLVLSLAISSASTFLPIRAGYGIARTIVVPDDYPTITEAISGSADGDTVLVKKGTHEIAQNQTLFINKTISLLAENPGSTSVLIHPRLVPKNIFTFEYMGYLDAFIIEADFVKIEGFKIISDGGGLIAVGKRIQIISNTLNFGVTATGDEMHIENNTLTGMRGITTNGSNQAITRNTIKNGTGEFLISSNGSYNTISLNKITGMGGGIYSNGSYNVIYSNAIPADSDISAGVEVNGNRNILYNNSIANFVCIGSARIPNTSSNLIIGNTITNNLGIVGNNNIFNGNYLEGLHMGNVHHDASNNTFYHNNFNFAKNTQWFSGEKTFTLWEGVKGPVFLDNGKEGNYYSDYNGTDHNSDGIGDTPYVIITKDPRNYHFIADFNIANLTLTDHFPLMAPFDISSINLDLPEQTPESPNPTPSPLPDSNTKPSPSDKPMPTPLPNTTPKQEPTYQQETEQSENRPVTNQQFLPLTYFAIAVFVSMLFLGTVITVKFKRRNRSRTL